MTGGEHYREAERYVASAHNLAAEGDEELAKLELGFAQVHATLAHAAAMVDDVWGRAQILGPPREETTGDRS